jgi:hypothetical protein
MKDAFPQGVCDFSKPAADQEPSIPWMCFADGPGGEPLGDTQTSTPGCVGKAKGKGSGAPSGCPGVKPGT